MIKSSREKTITKQLWYLNKKEKTRLAQTLRHYDESEFIQNYKTNNQFVVSFLKQKVFNSKEKSQMEFIRCFDRFIRCQCDIIRLFHFRPIINFNFSKASNRSYIFIEWGVREYNYDYEYFCYTPHIIINETCECIFYKTIN
ncbi:hypothetical protein [Staphylococcus chromogenes]|uniref:hypothetical protein n=1 Tax=Staphylococcus chromogenes TaxID=46126 RepID=UPI0021CE1DB2|nr:hypothetical protein [Staphylococcus chromogenes]UXS76405.1 hypothetical protein MUA20_05075 [Staphylococcus chromogenes]